MARYRVRFLKTIADSSGHLQACPQHSLEVAAGSSDEAVAAAQQAFCAAMRISDCHFYADAFEVECLSADREPRGRAENRPA